MWNISHYRMYSPRTASAKYIETLRAICAANGVVSYCGNLRGAVGYDLCWCCERLILDCAMLLLGCFSLAVARKVFFSSVLFHV